MSVIFLAHVFPQVGSIDRSDTEIPEESSVFCYWLDGLQLPESPGPRHRWVFGSLYRFPPQLPNKKVPIGACVVSCALGGVTVAAYADDERR
jgi:hypothetical protein